MSAADSHSAAPIGLLLRLMWRAAPGKSSALGICSFLAGAAPVGYILATAHLLAAMTIAAGGARAADSRAWLWDCAIITALFTGQQVLVPFTRALAHELGALLGLALRERTLEASLDRVGLAHLEQPDAARHVAQAALVGGRAFDTVDMVLTLSDKFAARVQGFGAALLLVTFHWWAPFAIWAAWSLLPTWIRHVTGTQMKAATNFSGSLRRAGYLRQLTLRPAAAKELRIFSLQDWLLHRFESARAAGFSDLRGERARLGLWLLPVLAAPAIVTAGLLFLIIGAVLRGELTLAQFTLYALALIDAKHIGHTMAWWVRGLHHAAAATHAAMLGERLQSCADLSRGTAPAANLPRHGVVFENVSFRYAAEGAPVLAGFNLTIPAGRSLAIVGENGAGKTTLAKLLARLHDPQAGRIAIDGTDLRELDPEAWRCQLAVIFQDFIRYESSARDNISPGGRISEAHFQAALDQAGARTLVASLPRGADTILSRAYPGGTDLSGGQWQRIALARAFAAV